MTDPVKLEGYRWQGLSIGDFGGTYVGTVIDADGRVIDQGQYIPPKTQLDRIEEKLDTILAALRDSGRLPEGENAAGG